MSTKKWKNNELMENLSEKFGFKMDLGLLKEAKEKMPDENNDGIPDYAQDGKGKNDLGKTTDSKDEESEDEESEKPESKGKKGKLNPGLQKYLDSKKKKNEAK